MICKVQTNKQTVQKWMSSGSYCCGGLWEFFLPAYNVNTWRLICERELYVASRFFPPRLWTWYSSKSETYWRVVSHGWRGFGHAPHQVSFCFANYRDSWEQCSVKIAKTAAQDWLIQKLVRALTARSCCNASGSIISAACEQQNVVMSKCVTKWYVMFQRLLMMIWVFQLWGSLT